MKEQDKIERIFQEGFKDFKVQPDPSVWSGIQSNISSGASGLSTGLSSFSATGKILLGLAVASGIALSTYLITAGDQSSDAERKLEESIPTKLQVETEGSPLFADSLEILENPGQIAPISSVESNSPAVSAEKTDVEVKLQESAVKSSSVAGKTENENADPKLDSTALLNVDRTIGNKSNGPEVGESSISQESVSEQPIQKNVEDIAENDESTKQENSSTEPSITNSGGMPNNDSLIKIPSTIPNIFTPNQDGHNDVFRVETDVASNMEAVIFDQRGKTIFQWKGLFGFWDGSMPNGEPALEGNYFYRIVLFKDDFSTVETGYVILKR